MAAACTSKTKPTEKESHHNRDLQLTSEGMTPEVLWSFGRLGAAKVSPDGTTVLYAVTYTNIEENRAYTDLYTIATTGGTPTQITNTDVNEGQHDWRPDGQKITFLSAESGAVQLWQMEPDGSQRERMTAIEGGITGYQVAPDQKHIVYSKPVKLDDTVNDIHPDLPLANARIETDLMYRHWDSWHDYTYSHLFIAPFEEGGLIKEGTDIMEGERFDAPLKPFGGMEQLAWSPSGQQLVYTSKKLKGKAYAFSTNSDLYLYDLQGRSTTNLTEGMAGYDKNPVFSPDGSQLLWESMARDGYEADKNRLFLRDMASGEKRDLTTQFDHNAGSPVWDRNGDFIWFTSNVKATYQIHLLSLRDGSINQVTEGQHNFNDVAHTGEALIATRVSMSAPADLFRIGISDGSATNLTKINEPLLNQLSLGKVEERWVTTTDKQQMLVWVIYPPDFDPNKKYPTILYCQGGPQSGVSQFWSYRWNFQLMAANDYIIVAPNRRGLPGFGTEWNEQISGDYGGQNMDDYLSAIDALAKEPFVDEDRLGAVGASYGGYSVYWLAGNHNNRFKAFISHCGIFNSDMMYTTTEEMFFVDWDMDGPYWEHPNKQYAFSPHLFVDQWDTPMMVIHSEKDFRIPYTQGMGAFNAARIKDLPAKFLYFPEENHWVLSAQNGILWQREFTAWLDQWLKQ
ncbi:MAG: S9 family peptidase [Bacteroidales bacterium]|nr:S9 family peptidase [Bacteroidales bacterium]